MRATIVVAALLCGCATLECPRYPDDYLRTTWVKAQVVDGVEVEVAIAAAMTLARQREATVEFSYNGVRFQIDAQTSRDDAHREYLQRLRPVQGH